jgi:hypothetical protein
MFALHGLLAALALLVPAAAPPPAPAATGPLAVRLEPGSDVKDPAGLLAAIDKPFDEPWKVKVGRNGPERALASCAQLGVEFPGGTLLTGDPADQRPLLFERTHCRGLLWLRDAKPSKQSFLGELPLDLDTARTLPDSLIPALGARRKPRPSSRSWKAADPKLGLMPDPPPRAGLYLRGRNYDARLSLYGRGDFDGDGFEDVLVRRDGFAIGGSYQEFGLFLLTRTAAGAPFKVLRSISEGY